MEKLKGISHIDSMPLQDQFREFLASQYVPLPKDRSHQYRLMCALQDSVYHMLEKQGGLAKLAVALMNEERRRIKKLPPLSVVDYNCMDRASIKVRMVLDTLQMERRISGTALVPRDLGLHRRMRAYEEKRTCTYPQVACKMDHLSVRLMKLMGLHEEVAPQINLVAASIQASGAQIQTRGNQARLS